MLATYIARSIKLTAILVAFPAMAFMASFRLESAAADEYPLAPNPNPWGNTITIASGDVGGHSVETFTNFGTIVVQTGGTLRNLAQMDIIVDEDGGG